PFDEVTAVYPDITTGCGPGGLNAVQLSPLSDVSIPFHQGLSTRAQLPSKSRKLGVATPSSSGSEHAPPLTPSSLRQAFRSLLHQDVRTGTITNEFIAPQVFPFLLHQGLRTRTT